MTAEQLASLAQSLRDNEAFEAAMTTMRDDALERLATMPRSDEEAFYLNQAIVKVVDDLHAQLEQFIRSGKPKTPPGIA